MTDKELKKLKRTELLELLIAQGRQVDDLKDRVSKLEAELADRTIKIKEAGSIAEAALKLNDIFEQAQKAADDYVNSVKARS